MSRLHRHREVLRERFAELVLAEKPFSVLDVGCGRGELAQRIAAAGVPVEGLEADGGLVESLRERGLSVREGSATQLPFDDGSFDWVVVRHVIHHVEQPGQAVAEAFRVCGTGIAIAEPCFDARLPGHALSLELERWAIPQHRRSGHVHAESWDAAQILAAVPEAVDVVVETCLPITIGDVDDADEQYGRWTEGFAADDGAVQAYRDLRARVEAEGFGLGGSVMVFAKKNHP